MSVEFTIICNFCGSAGDASTQRASAARKARREQRGWKTNLPGEEDKCTHCQQQGITGPPRVGDRD